MADPPLHSPLCIALDSPDRATNERIAAQTERHVGMFKIGLTTFISGGRDIVSVLGARRPVFLDLKLHDIPAQVAGAVSGAASAGAALTTVHAAGGAAMMRAAVDAADGRLGILAVTVLTSLDDRGLAEVGLAGPADAAVLRLAELALGTGVAGLVCSPHEVAAIRARFGPRSEGGPLLVVPGIRPLDGGVARDDQKRTLSPAAARTAGANVLVVGRPITGASDPAAAAASLLVEIAA